MFNFDLCTECVASVAIHGAHLRTLRNGEWCPQGAYGVEDSISAMTTMTVLGTFILPESRVGAFRLADVNGQLLPCVPVTTLDGRRLCYAHTAFRLSMRMTNG